MSAHHSAEAVATEIVQRLGGIAVASGCETGIGAKVYQGLRRIDDEMIPCCVVIEGDDSPGQFQLNGDLQIEQKYVLYAYLECDPLNPNVKAHAAIRDMKRALFLTDGKPDKRWARRVVEVKYLGRDIGPRTDGAKFVLAAIEVAVDYVENLANPG